MSPAKPGRVQAVARAIDVLTALGDGPRRLTEISRKTRLPKGTVFRLLQSLTYGLLVSKDPDTDLWMLGPGALGLLQGVLLGVGGVVAGRGDALTRLQVETGETVAVHVRLGLDRVCIYELPSLNPLRYTVGTGTATPLHAGSAGKAILAMMPDAEVAKILDHIGLKRLTENTIVDADQLLRDLARTRQQGYATSLGEVVAGVCAISVGFGGSSGTTAALSVYGPASRVTPARFRELAAALKRAVGDIQQVFGAEPTTTPPDHISTRNGQLGARKAPKVAPPRSEKSLL